jgi:hypothetical protein
MTPLTRVNAQMQTHAPWERGRKANHTANAAGERTRQPRSLRETLFLPRRERLDSHQAPPFRGTIWTYSGPRGCRIITRQQSTDGSHRPQRRPARKRTKSTRAIRHCPSRPHSCGSNLWPAPAVSKSCSDFELLVFTQNGVPTWEVRYNVRKDPAQGFGLLASGTADCFNAAKSAALHEASMQQSAPKD